MRVGRLVATVGRLGMMLIMVALAIACAYPIVLPASDRRSEGTLLPGAVSLDISIIVPGTVLKVRGHANGDAFFYVLDVPGDIVPFLLGPPPMNITRLDALLASPDVRVLAEGRRSINYERFLEESASLVVVAANRSNETVTYELEIQELVRLVAPKHMYGLVPILALVGALMAVPHACAWLKAKRTRGTRTNVVRTQATS